MSFSEVIDELNKFITTGGWKIVRFFAVLVVGILLIKAIVKIIKTLFMKGPMDKTLGSFVVSIIRFVLYLALIFILAGVAGIDMSPLTTALLSVGLAVSLALQDSLSNLANGVIIIATKPFKAGDYIEVSGVGGTVKNIRMISTELITFDNRSIIIPNSKITGDNIVNVSARPTRRLDFNLTLDCFVDLEKVKKIFLKILTENDMILNDPEPAVRVMAIDAGFIKLSARAWVGTGDYWSAFWDVNEKILLEFKAEDINIPHNKLDVKINKEEF